ncbi:SoxR reducing system RseC family protein [Aurantivibrio infirmus]
MLKETGRIVAIDTDWVWVETISQSSCGSCSAQKGCGQSLLAKWASKNSYIKVLLNGRDSSSFKVNDSVSIAIPENVVVFASLLLYLLPIVLMLVGGVLGQYLFNSEVISILGAIVGLLCGGIAVKIYSVLSSRDKNAQPVIIDIVSSHERLV